MKQLFALFCLLSSSLVFAAGDIVRGASLVVWAIRDGREAADAIMDQTLRRIVVAVVGNPLHQRASAVAHADHGDLDWLHE